MFQLLRFHLPLLGIACAVMMAPMLANANSDNASANAAFVEKSNFFSRLFAEIKCDSFEEENCKCGRHKCRPTQAFSAGTCCIAGYVSECCDQLFFPRACTSAANDCPCGWGTCVLNTGQAGDDCCNAHHSWKCCDGVEVSGHFRAVDDEMAQESMFRVYGLAVSHEFGWAKKCIIAFVVLFDLLMQRNIIF